MAGFHTNLESKIPVTIGTIPLANVAVPAAPPADSVAVNMNPQNPDTAPVGWVGGDKNGLYPTVPPVFAQSQFGTSTIQDKSDNEHTRYNNNAPQYNPMYPVYNFQGNPQ